MKVLSALLISAGRVTLTPVAEDTESMVVVLRAVAAQSNLALVQVVLLPVVAQYPHKETLYESARSRSDAVIFVAPSVPRAEARADEAADSALEVVVDGLRAARVKSEMDRLEMESSLARLRSSDEEMERFCVSASKR